MWGLTLQQIKYITNHPNIEPDTTMREVVEIVIKPATKGLGIGYALLVNQVQPLCAKVMVSVSTLLSIVWFYIQLGHSLTLPIFYCVENVRQNSNLFSHPKQRAQRNTKSVRFKDEVRTYSDVVKQNSEISSMNINDEHANDEFMESNVNKEN